MKEIKCPRCGGDKVHIVGYVKTSYMREGTQPYMERNIEIEEVVTEDFAKCCHSKCGYETEDPTELYIE